MANFKISLTLNLASVVGNKGFWANPNQQKNTLPTNSTKLNKNSPKSPLFPHKLKLFPTAKLNANQIFVLILADDELFEFV